jgi:hypothetical protein
MKVKINGQERTLTDPRQLVLAAELLLRMGRKRYLECCKEGIRRAAEAIPPGKSLLLEVTELGDWTFSLVDD